MANRACLISASRYVLRSSELLANPSGSKPTSPAMVPSSMGLQAMKGRDWLIGGGFGRGGEESSISRRGSKPDIWRGAHLCVCVMVDGVTNADAGAMEARNNVLAEIFIVFVGLLWCDKLGD